MPDMKTIPGRQGTGYLKRALLEWKGLDAWILTFPEGSRVPPHVDRIPGRAHFRLNIVLQEAAVGGQFICADPIFASRRVAFFRSDKSVHCVSRILRGERKVLSSGFAPPTLSD